MVKKRCFLCAKRSDEFTSFEDIEVAKVPASKKSIKVVLQHLANCIKAKLNFDEFACICPKCQKELSEYDDLMLKLLTFQKKLTKLLESALKNDEYLDDFEEFQSTKDEFDDSVVVKDEEEDFDEVDTDGVEDTDDDDTPEAKKIKRLRECTVCNKLFDSKLQLTQHRIEMHDAPQVYSCHICGAVRKDEEYLELHMNLHEGKTENECRYCPKRYSRPTNTLRHMRKHWDKKKFQCEKCGLRFSQDNILYNHKMRHEAEENPLICSICNQSFRTRKTFTHHMQTHSENRKRHQCDFCSKSFTERYTLKMHMKTHPEIIHEIVVQEPVNEEIVTFETEAAVCSLMSNCSEETPCVICGFKFETKEALNEHLEKEHDVILSSK